MPRLELNAEDLAKLRVDASWGPLTESLLSLRLLRGRRSTLLVAGWREAVDHRVGREAVPLIALAPGASYADLHTIVGPVGSIDEGLHRLEAARPDHLGAELSYLAEPGAGISADWALAWLRDLCGGDRRARRELVTRLGRYFEQAVAPYWDSIRAYLDAERVHRTRIMAEGGVDRLLATLHPRVRWRPPFLDIGDSVTADEGSGPSARLDGRSLVLVPSVFSLDGPHVLTSVADETSPSVLLYPALRDVGDAAALWTPRTSNHQALAMLIGRTRARALEAIADSCTTTELAHRLSVSPATASHHASVLRAAGLVTSRRSGATVLHHLTALGATLLGEPSHGDQ